METDLKASGGINSITDSVIDSVFRQAFFKLNKALHKSGIDDNLSGTTGITIFLHQEKLYIANVGDSRAIIASETKKGLLKYSPLSSDQTPYRKDERERLKSHVFLFLYTCLYIINFHDVFIYYIGSYNNDVRSNRW